MTPAEEERARVVAFMREAARQIAAATEAAGMKLQGAPVVHTLDLIAGHIERGEHIKEQPE